MTVTATDLHRRAQERNGGLETLADIVQRARFAAEWNTKQAEKSAATSAGFWAKMLKDKRYTAQQREDAICSAAYEQGRVAIFRDAAAFADSIADALVAVVGS